MNDPIARIRVEVADITRLHVEAIVNAANRSLLGGGGVDGAIHRAAGPALLEHTRSLGGCETGLAVVTPAFGLESQGIRMIIHAVGPVWTGDGGTIGTRESERLGDRVEDVLLASCYQRSLELAASHGANTIAFPAISTGVYRFPLERAAKIALGHVHGWLLGNALPREVTFCCFSPSDAEVYQRVIETRDQWMFSRKRG